MEAGDYESLPASSTASTHMIAGAAAGMMEHLVMYPIDCVKTRMQCLVPDPNANYRNIADALYRIIRYEGIGHTVRGISAVIYGAGPAHALYFSVYEHLKKQLSRNQQGNALAHGLAGVGATLVHDAVMNPAEVIKQRMQVYNSSYSGCLQCARSIARHEGLKAFYRSYTTQLVMNIPFQSLHFIVYEFCQEKMNGERQYNPSSHMVSGAIAGAMAAAVTTPLDVCKTLLNTQEKCALTQSETAISGIGQALRTVYHFRGLSGFFIGLTPRVIYQMPSTAICWSVYELFKYTLTKRQSEADGYVTPSSIAPAVPVRVVTAVEKKETN